MELATGRFLIEINQIASIPSMNTMKCISQSVNFKQEMLLKVIRCFFQLGRVGCGWGE